MIDEKELVAKKSWHVSEQVSDWIRRGFEEHRPQPRNYLGASALGDPCSRRIVYGLQGVEPDQPSTCERYCTFEIGHTLEGLVASWLIQAGFILQTRGEDQAPFGFSQTGGRFQGHVDGIIRGGPLDAPYPLLWENKTAKASSWREFMKGRLEVVNEIYYAQVQVYMAYLNLENCLFTSLNKDTSQIYSELVPFDAEVAARYSDKAVRILQNQDAGIEEPRVATCSDFFECRRCRFREKCWGKQG